MDVLNRELEAVEAAGLGDLNLRREVARNVLEDDAVGRGKEGQDVLDEVPLVVVELLPVRQVLAEVDLLDSPEAGLRGGNARGERESASWAGSDGLGPPAKDGTRGRGRAGGGAKGHLVLLVHLPDLLVLDREQHEAVGVRGQEGIGRRHGPLWVGWLLCSSLLSFRTALPGKPGFGGTGQLPNIDIMKLFIFPGRVLLHLC